MRVGGEIRSDEGDGYSSGVLKFIAKFPAPYHFMLYSQPVVSFLPAPGQKFIGIDIAFYMLICN
jgi:hypothetical protein